MSRMEEQKLQKMINEGLQQQRSPQQQGVSLTIHDLLRMVELNMIAPRTAWDCLFGGKVLGKDDYAGQ